MDVHPLGAQASWWTNYSTSQLYIICNQLMWRMVMHVTSWNRWGNGGNNINNWKMIKSKLTGVGFFKLFGFGQGYRHLNSWKHDPARPTAFLNWTQHYSYMQCTCMHYQLPIPVLIQSCIHPFMLVYDFHFSCSIYNTTFLPFPEFHLIFL